MNKTVLASLIALAGWTSLAQAQASLGSPVISRPPFEAHASAMPPPIACNCKIPVCPGFCHLAHSMLAPIRLATGNLLPEYCADALSREEAERMMCDGGYSPAVIAAAKIKLDEAQARARRAAVRYLATVDCHYFPEAEMGLVAALRADRNECVRYEAALALQNCRHLTIRAVHALNVAAMGTEADGNPGETSERVRNAARLAMQRGLAQHAGMPAHGPHMLPPPDWSAPAPTPPGLPAPLPVQPMSYNGLTVTGLPLSYYTRMMPMSGYPMSVGQGNSSAIGAPMNPDSPGPLQEQNFAARVSAESKAASPATGQRTLYHLFLSATNPQTNQRSLGLTPLGSAASLSIPR